MSAYVQTARLYEETNQTEKALKYLYMADSAGTVIHDEINLAEIKTFMAENFLHKDSLDAAEAMCTEGLKVIQSKNIIRMLPHAYLTLGQIKAQKNDLRGSEKIFHGGTYHCILHQRSRTKNESSLFFMEAGRKRKE